MTELHPLARACTFLFVPGHRPDRFDKALQSGADAVILDLEDAVPLSDKAKARDAITQAWQTWTSAQRARVLIRINALSSNEATADLAWLGTLDGLSAVMVPKAESVAELQRVAKGGPVQMQLVPLIETAQAVRALDVIAQAPQVLRLALGHLDLQADLGMACEADEAELGPVRFQLVLASRCAGLPPPIDGVSTSTQDMALVQSDAARSRRFGFFAKLCIHPAQLQPVRAAFMPTALQRDWAHRVLAAETAAGGGAFSVDGKMVDPPVLRLARQILVDQ
ncbi:CoA ester lyase [Limnohabitans sp. B9-3]|uniref:HpcH/HpaI aldolase/citrate lyase family protein n=1 Tax=Limnohabitans sp. B9-3 TaxID=1100707 RepID=UPI000C1ED286|nr:CoA ester lyase [Limnohabitans sp. B9-3]PIT75305.1 CoA ester lyase [Limnohabitans sp. B9-3]